MGLRGQVGFRVQGLGSTAQGLGWLSGLGVMDYGFSLCFEGFGILAMRIWGVGSTAWKSGIMYEVRCYVVEFPKQ